MYQFLLVALLAAASVATNLHSKSNETVQSKANPQAAPKKKILQQPEIEQQLVVCNAYTSPASLDIYHVQKLSYITGSVPLKYKECREFLLALEEGDQLDFQADTLDVGTFYATGLPTSTSAKLLLIPHRRNKQAVGISFESHAFTDTENAQIAILDTYRGNAQSSVKIHDVPAEGDKGSPVEERLEFSSVVSVNPGKYKVSLADGSSKKLDNVVSLLVQKQAKCVVMRVGSEFKSKEGKQLFPQELVVFPESGSFRQVLGVGTFLFCIMASVFTSSF